MEARLALLHAIRASCALHGSQFFTGVLSPMSGVLEPKRLMERYLLPPFSLCFNVLTNPGLAAANVAVMALLGCGNAFVPFRLVLPWWVRADMARAAAAKPCPFEQGHRTRAQPDGR